MWKYKNLRQMSASWVTTGLLSQAASAFFVAYFIKNLWSWWGYYPQGTFLCVILFKIIVVSQTLIMLHNSFNTIIYRKCRVHSQPIQKGKSFEMAAKQTKNIYLSKSDYENRGYKFLVILHPLGIDNCTIFGKVFQVDV